MSLFCSHGTHYQSSSTSATSSSAQSDRPQSDKPTVVLIHGVGLDLSLWQAQVEALKATHHVITYDMLGHGLSPNAPTDISLDTLAQQLHSLIDHLKLDKISLIGFSLGGLVARVFAISYPHRLHRLCIMNSVFDRSDALRTGILNRVDEVAKHGPSANIDQALTRWFSRVYTQKNPRYIAQLKAKVLANHSASYGLCYRLFGEGDNVNKDQLHSITCPTLVTTGALDAGSTPAMSYALAAKMPCATVSVLAGARHMMPVENADEVNQVLHTFINAY